jgi:uroporphyrin-III C-methyltransferase
VFLVGAGPGDPELLTVKALRAIAEADVIVYDRLVSEAVLDRAPRGAARINVGKQPNHHPVPQEEINALLVKLARSGRSVVRLKGGDPLVFGRGSEEALHLRSNDIAYEVVPGITAAQGASASLGVPLTHRGMATGVRYVTGHCRQNLDLDLDWPGLADAQTTVVIYMGAANIAQFADQLMAHGRGGATPVVAVNNATLPSERRLFSTLDRIAPDAAAAAFTGPVLFIVGEVVGLHEQLSANGERDELAHLAATAH